MTYTFSGAQPTVIATQIGAGAYTQAALASSKLTLTIPSGTTNYSVAFLCPTFSVLTSSSNIEQVIQASTEDGTSFSEDCTTIGPSSTAIVQVNAAAISGGVFVLVDDQVQSWSSNTLTFAPNLPNGTDDVAVYVTGASQNALAARILRSQTVPGNLNGGNPVVLGNGDEAVPETMTYSGVPAGYSVEGVAAVYETANGASLPLCVGCATQYPAMPASAFQSGDYYEFVAQAQSNASPGQLVASENFTSKASAVSLAFPAAWTYSGPKAAALPAFSFNYAGFSGMPDVSYDVLIEWLASVSSSNIISVTASANYQGGATSISIPDLSGVAGFLAPASSGNEIDWVAEVNQGNPSLTTPPSGTRQSVLTSGAYVEP